MWFRNLLVYRFTQSVNFDLEQWEQALAKKPALACGSQVLTTYGFTAPFGKAADAPLIYASQHFFLLAAQKEERLLPASVVKDAVNEKVEEIENAQGRKVYKKERDQIKDEVTLDFLPRAFIRRSRTLAAIDTQAGLIYVDASSAKKAEELLSTLREAIGSLPIQPLEAQQATTASFTQWLQNMQIGHGFSLKDECELRDTAEDGGVIRIKREDLGSEEIQNLLAAGKIVTQLALNWEEKLSFVLDDKLAIKRLKFEDLLQEQAEQDGGDEAAGQFDASFNLMMLTLAEFLPQLMQSLGGEAIHQRI
ncbi:recombination-associated protein RdgC [Thiopseudomonas alkaliphila]|uniref:Recombination-associated protein RdgC n=1 Tax=Thiopseudomonas alkaliphila TaxID=1697053 RepID=A0A0K1XD26_9GAMM|nr:recombination-associated protein RdgC [Thiopseudomonas alkaliphila]AKX51533.1 recombinase RdgC [Thiopseudomonas alkaliphila]AKX55783.1 recombinase RdgC [Thiopseudomonas alkaliphila]AKX57877.1 recombinase RdgC [Thiopseudomonas alkaliphila]AKX59226.1 recombinase RdgC [Thiopseudomonas alkaliphila]MDM1716311.1 recombination-associated protein RdgC [Thiopseudomonas alkaliphila]